MVEVLARCMSGEPGGLNRSRCNTRSEPQVQKFQRAKEVIREHKSREKASCLGKSGKHTQPRRIGPLETYCQIN